MTQALALRPDDAAALTPVQVSRPRSLVPHPSDLQAYVMIARNAPSAAGFAIPKGVDHPGKALAIMLAGYELGIGPMTAMRHIMAINGRTEPDAQLMMGICMANDPSVRFRWTCMEDDRASVEISRQDRVLGEFSYSLEDAKRAGQFDPDNPPTKPKVAEWKREGTRNIPVYARDEAGNVIMVEAREGYWWTHTRLALAYNAVKLGMKLSCPDLINGVLGAMMGGEAMLQAVEMGEAPMEAWDQVPEIDGDGDFVNWRPQGATRPRQAAGSGWGDTRPSQGQERRQGSPGGAKTAEQWNVELAEALDRHGVDAQAVASIVGGSKVGDVIRYLVAQELDLDGLMERAKALESTGELPGEDVPNDGIPEG